MNVTDKNCLKKHALVYTVNDELNNIRTDSTLQMQGIQLFFVV